MSSVISKAPLRLGLAGGGTDLEPYCTNYGGVVLSATIDQYAYCKVEPYDKWIFKSIDLDIEESYESLLSNYVYDHPLKLLINTYIYLVNIGVCKSPVKITTYCETPPGSGLGSSSAVVVSIIAALSEYLSIPMGEYDIAKIAFDIERNICHLPGGKQDQFAAAFGGFNYIEFLKENQTIVNPLRLNYKVQNMLEMNTVLYYVGKPRKDARVIETNMNNLMNDSKSIEATHKIKKACEEFKVKLLTGDVKGISQLMNDYWNLKLKTSDKIGSDELMEVYEYSLQNGATAGKISGAGGGGHLILFTEFENRHRLISALNKRETGKVVPFKFVKHGVDVWRI
jgi:D-glycero-alpha-D-manno-heptose-7-phosphate kinase